MARVKAITTAAALSTVKACLEAETQHIRNGTSDSARLKRAGKLMITMLEIQNLFEVYYYDVRLALGLRTKP